MNRDPLSNPEAYETDEETREEQADTAVDSMPDQGRSPLEGMSGPEDFTGGKMGQESTEPQTASSGKDWNLTGPVDEYGHRNTDQTSGESSDAGDREPQPKQTG